MHHRRALWLSLALTVNLIGNASINDKKNPANDHCGASKWSFVTGDENTVRCVFLGALNILLFKVAFLPT